MPRARATEAAVFLGLGDLALPLALDLLGAGDLSLCLFLGTAAALGAGGGVGAEAAEAWLSGLSVMYKFEDVVSYWESKPPTCHQTYLG